MTISFHSACGRVVRHAATVVLVALLIAASPATAEVKPGTKGLAIEAIEIVAKPLAAFDRTDSTKKTFGGLEWRGGLVLSSSNTNFGGWSGLTIDPDGRRFLSVSDAGTWMTGELAYEGNKPKGIRNARLGPLLALGGKPLASDRDRDAESVRLIDGSLAKGTVLISFERNHRIGRFEISDKGLSPPLGYLKRSPDWPRMSSNKSLESVTLIAGGPLKGGVIAFAERLLDTAGNNTGWLWPTLAAEPQRLMLTRSKDFDITDAVSLDDGSLIVLERSFKWTEGVRMRLRQIRAGDVRPGALLDGQVLLEADMSQEIDNMEGLAVHKGPRGETVLTLISDDNFNGFLQRTILLQFALPAPRTTAAVPR